MFKKSYRYGVSGLGTRSRDINEKQDALLTAPTTEPNCVWWYVCVYKQKPQQSKVACVYRDIVKSLKYRANCFVYKRADQKASTEVQSDRFSPFLFLLALAWPWVEHSAYVA